MRGQYTAGTEFGQPVPGYRQEANVAPDSRTETYVAAEAAASRTGAGRACPFTCARASGWRSRRTEIAIHFKPAPYQIFRDTPVDQLTPNIVKLMIDPEQGISTQFSAKVPGPVMKLGGVDTSFLYKDFFEEKPNVGYETLLYDCMMGDATLFQRADNIESSLGGGAAGARRLEQGGRPRVLRGGQRGAGRGGSTARPRRPPLAATDGMTTSGGLRSERV